MGVFNIGRVGRFSIARHDRQANTLTRQPFPGEPNYATVVSIFKVGQTIKENRNKRKYDNFF